VLQKGLQAECDRDSVSQGLGWERAMMGRRNQSQGQLFYEFCLDDAVPDDHLVRQIASLLDLSWVYGELAPYYSAIGRPSIDPVLMIRMLILGHVFAIRSERQLCREVQVNLAYRWFCDLGLEDAIPGPLGVLACPQRAFPGERSLPSYLRAWRPA
jgi:hypothetical protein